MGRFFHPQLLFYELNQMSIDYNGSVGGKGFKSM